jgi:hypothetical protein
MRRPSPIRSVREQHTNESYFFEERERVFMRSTNPKPGGLGAALASLAWEATPSRGCQVIPFEKRIINKPVSI